MNERVKKLTAEAAKLSPEERSELIEGILTTFNAANPEIDALWLVEAQDRLQAYKRGEMAAYDMDDVLAKHLRRLDSK